jgi:hypothetical protein
LCAGNPVLVAEDADPPGRNPPFLCNFKRRKIFHNQPSLFTILLFIIFHNRNNLNPYFKNSAAFHLAILQVLEAVFYFLCKTDGFFEPCPFSPYIEVTGETCTKMKEEHEMDIFTTVKAAVTVRQAAEHYGLQVIETA